MRFIVAVANVAEVKAKPCKYIFCASDPLKLIYKHEDRNKLINTYLFKIDILHLHVKLNIIARPVVLESNQFSINPRLQTG